MKATDLRESKMTTPADDRQPRLNRLIELWERDLPALGCFAKFRDPEGAAYYASAPQDFVVYDLEHTPADFAQLRIFLQFMIDRGRLLAKGNGQPDVVPLVRIPANGSERSQWLIKQVLDAGAYGLLAPHIKNTEDARALVSNVRYPHRPGNAQTPPGERGVSPFGAARYWGVSAADYLERADTWPLNPSGEIAIVALIESREGVENIRRILTEAPGIAAIFVGTYDLSTALGYPGQMDHPETEAALQQVLAVATELRIPCGVPVNRGSIEQRLRQGFKMLVAAGTPGEIEETLRLGRQLRPVV